MKLLIAAALCAPLWAQFAITSPAASSTVSGAMTFAVTQPPAGTVTVEYVYDGWRPAGLAPRTPWTLIVPAGEEWMDGARVLTAIARGADGTTLATSAGVPFTIDNFGGSAFSFNLSGTSGTVSLTISGMPSGATATCFVDGIRSVEPFIDLNGSQLKTDYWDEADDTIHWENGHALAPGDPVYYQAGTASSPLTGNTLYYAVPVDKWKFRLATSRTNALAGTYINLGTIGSSTQKFTRRLGTDRWFIQDTTPRTIDSTRLSDGSHVVTCNAYGGTLINSFFTGSIKPIASYSATLTTVNGAAPMELRGPSQMHLTAGGASYAIAPYLANTNGTKTTLTSTSVEYFSTNPAVATVSTAGVVTPLTPGVACIRMRYSNSAYALDVPVTVLAAKRFKHFSRGGAILSSYSATNSHLATNVFELGSSYWESNPEYGLSGSGVNTASESLPQDIHTAASAGVFATFWNGYWPSLQSRLNTWGLGSLWIGDNLASNAGLSGVWRILNQPTSQANLGTALTALRDSARATFIVMKDEVNSTFKSGPQYMSTWASGTYRFSSLTVDAAGMITLSYTAFPGWSASATGTSTVCISGASTAGLNGCYLMTSRLWSTVTLVKTSAAAGTYNSTTDPGLRVTVWQDYEKQETSKTVTASGGSCSAPVSSAAANGWTAGRTFGVFGNPADTDLRRFWQIASLPNSNTIQWTCADVSDGTYTGMTLRLLWASTLPHNALQAFKAQFDATAGRPALGWPIEAVGGNDAIAQWETLSDYTDLYNNMATNAGSPLGHPASEYYDRYTTPMRRLEVRNLEAPLVTQISATYADYSKQSTTGDWPRWSVDKRTSIGDRSDMLAAGVWSGLAQGASGFRTYFFDVPNKQSDRRTMANGSSRSIGLNPLWTPDLWRAMKLSYSLAQRFRELCLSPQITAPSYGRKFVTGARESATQRMLIITSFSDNTETLTVDLTELAYAGGSVARWKVNDRRIAVAVTSGASDTVTLTSGETAVYVFTNGASPLRTYTASQPHRAGAAAVAVRYGTDAASVRLYGEGVNCGASACSFPYDPGLPLFAVFTQLSPGGTVLAESCPVRLN